MASTYTTNTGIEKPGSGEQSGTWGTTTNTNFDIIDDALNGVISIALTGSGPKDVNTPDGASDEGTHKVLLFTGSLSGGFTVNITPNNAEKLYLVYNTTGQTLTFSQGSGANATVLDGRFAWIYANGAGSGAAVVRADFVPANLSVNTDQIADNAITSAKIADATIVATDLADGAVNSAKILDGTIVNADISDAAAIGFNKMANLTASRALVSDGNGDVSAASVTSTELGYLSGVTSSVQTQINNIAGYPQVITTLTSGSSYTIPSNAQAILIRASGGGGGGSVHANPGTGGLGTNSVTLGGDGGTTTVTNSTLGIAITAKGGPNGTNMGSDAGTGNWFTNVGSGSTGGDIFYNVGASGGRSTTNNFDGGMNDGGNGVVVQKYVTGNNVGGQTLSYSLGAGGTATSSGGSIQPEPGRPGYIEITVW